MTRPPCGDVITDRNDEHRTYACAKPEGHRSAHASAALLSGTSFEDVCIWTDATHWDDGEEER